MPNVQEEQQQQRPRPRRRYTAEERAKVLADVPQLGVVGAASKHGVPLTTVSQWNTGKRAAGVLQQTPVTAAAAVPEAIAAAEASVRASAKPETIAPAPAKPPGSAAPHRAAAKRYTPSQRAEVVEYAAAHGVSEAAQKFGTSRFSVFAWRRKVERAARGEAPSPTTGPALADVEAQRDAEILSEWSRHPGLGPSQVRNQLRRKGVKVSVHTTRRVMESAGYRPPKVERVPHDQRFEAVRPNHLWHLDFVHRHINRATVFTLILIDDCSRFVVGHGVDEAERADTVIAAFEEAVRLHGKPESIMTDRGAAFWSWRGISRFTALLTELGVDQIVAVDKEHNGKVEVFNANLHKELFDVQRFYDLAEMRRRLEAHLHWYNQARTHHALGGLLVPADRYFGRAEQVLARIEAGAGRELTDGVDLRDRCLELFKVTSRDGVPEVWLMGRRLLGASTSTSTS